MLLLCLCLNPHSAPSFYWCLDPHLLLAWQRIGPPAQAVEFQPPQQDPTPTTQHPLLNLVLHNVRIIRTFRGRFWWFSAQSAPAAAFKHRKSGAPQPEHRSMPCGIQLVSRHSGDLSDTQGRIVVNSGAVSSQGSALSLTALSKDCAYIPGRFWKQSWFLQINRAMCCIQTGVSCQAYALVPMLWLAQQLICMHATQARRGANPVRCVAQSLRGFVLRGATHLFDTMAPCALQLRISQELAVICQNIDNRPGTFMCAYASGQRWDRAQPQLTSHVLVAFPRSAPVRATQQLLTGTPHLAARCAYLLQTVRPLCDPPTTIVQLLTWGRLMHCTACKQFDFVTAQVAVH